jgi:ABC-type glycerol-3-phosphate transport system permease component
MPEAVRQRGVLAALAVLAFVGTWNNVFLPFLMEGRFHHRLLTTDRMRDRDDSSK